MVTGRGQTTARHGRRAVKTSARPPTSSRLAAKLSHKPCRSKQVTRPPKDGSIAAEARSRSGKARASPP
eukprot:10267369-Lingulodinium_polyedra.AAC.1